jgi:hypothetical protein
LRRLFSTFAGGVPGVGLLFLRLVAGGALIVDAVQASGDTISGMMPHLLGALAGLLLLLGLWTPGAGTVLAISEIWTIRAHITELRSCILLASLGLALAMIGPGAWSLDAYIYGWKRIEIPKRYG